MREAFLNYRIDNEQSSVKSGAKVFCVCDEYAEFESFIASHPHRAEAFKTMIPVKKYETYLWNYNRLDDSLKPSFLERMTQEFSEAARNNCLDKKLFAPVEWDELMAVISNPESLKGKNLTVIPPNFNVPEHQKTRYINNEISGVRLIASRVKHTIKKLRKQQN